MAFTRFYSLVNKRGIKGLKTIIPQIMIREITAEIFMTNFAYYLAALEFPEPRFDPTTIQAAIAMP